ncbi:TonB family protein [Allochromatium tepidum]|uniref:TonB C-terminal domain-containing protein n=1 Tax=Allochromatium tepidum TaxID=553982 RepID=A0ABN6GDJ2_9GAMM|nr:energy transducer TonB [Allochromatium tepidum]BCU08017.1 hypothetical protein Atep_26940 [Allochromatium tepidum]
MEIRAHHWLIALTVAGAVHGVVLLVWPTPSSPTPQAEPVYSLRLAVSEPPGGTGADEPGGGGDPEPIATEQPTPTLTTSAPMPKDAIRTPPSAPTTTPKTPTPEEPRGAKSVEVAKARKREEPKRPVETRQVRPKNVSVKPPAPSKPAAGAESHSTGSGAIASTAGKGTSDSAAKGDRTQAGRGGSGRGANDGGAGQGVDPANVRRYHATLAAWLARHKRYPEPARRRQEQGVVRVTFSIDRQGRLLSHRIESSSGYPVLDQEVKAMLQRASPMPPIPASLGLGTLTITVPISFSLR